MFFVGQQVFIVHLLQPERRGRLRRREIVQPAVDLRPGALLADHRVAAAVRGYLAEKAVQIDLLSPQRGRPIRHDLIGRQKRFQLVYELRAALLVVRALLLHMRIPAGSHRKVDHVVDVHVLLDITRVIFVVVPDVHRALEVRKQAHVQRPTRQSPRLYTPRNRASLPALAARDVLHRQRRVRPLQRFVQPRFGRQNRRRAALRARPAILRPSPARTASQSGRFRG